MIADHAPFSTTLRQALERRGITASDLARRVWGADSKNGRGARNRDLISNYLAGRSQPKPATVERIAMALQMPADELVPNLATLPKVQIEAIYEGNTVRLKINRDVDHATAMKILDMLSA